MNPATINRRIGTWINTNTFGETVRAYVPVPLPSEPPVDLSGLIGLLDKANQALGRMDGIACVLPDKAFYLYMNIRKEALISSQVEGTQSSLADLLLVEGDEPPEESPMRLSTMLKRRASTRVPGRRNRSLGPAQARRLAE